MSHVALLCDSLEAHVPGFLVHKGSWVNMLFFTLRPFLLWKPVQGRLASWAWAWAWMWPSSEGGSLRGISMAFGISGKIRAVAEVPRLIGQEFMSHVAWPLPQVHPTHGN